MTYCNLHYQVREIGTTLQDELLKTVQDLQRVWNSPNPTPPAAPTPSNTCDKKGGNYNPGIKGH